MRKPKFKVGDKTRYYDKDQSTVHHVITGIEGKWYKFNTYNESTGEMEVEDNTYYILDFDHTETLYTKDIVATKIARKVHPDAEDLGNGKLRIKK